MEASAGKWRTILNMGKEEGSSANVVGRFRTEIKGKGD